MNRSKTMTLAAQAMLSAATSAYCRIDTRHAGDDYSLGLTYIKDGIDTTNAGGTDITLAKGTLVGDPPAGTGEVQQQAETSDTSQAGENAGTGESKAVGSEQQQT